MMKKNYLQVLALFRSGLLLMLVSVFPSTLAQDSYTLGLNGTSNFEELFLPVGKSQIIESADALSQVVVGNPNVADVRLLNDNQFLVVGQAPGITNLAFRDTNSQIIALLDVVVGYDLVAIRRKLDEILPDERDLEVSTANGQVLLRGSVSSAAAQDAALAVTRTFAGGAIVNLLQVGGGQQVLLEARIAEVNRTRMRDLGVQTDVIGGAGSETDLRLFSGSIVQEAFGIFQLENTSVSDDILVSLSALQREGAAQILAEPNIVALSGDEASFLVGGEFPVPVVQTNNLAGGITIQFREFGVGLTFTPTVLSSDRINLKLITEVSDIDLASGTAVLGTTVPGLRTRRFATSVELGDGNSFAIAGLLQNDISSVVQELPGLGNVPIIGALFRSTEFAREETELVVIVTPRLVGSVDRNAISDPTDSFRPPGAVDLMLNGEVEAPLPEEGTEQEEGLDGAQGHQF